MVWKKLLFLPLALIYQLVLFIRHKLYDLGIIRSKSFDLPIICVGNLSFGGTGKTPHIEYLTELLKSDYKIAILSRGYKRKSKGFKLADENAQYREFGDEPMQFLNKYDDIYIAVDENRVSGVNKLLRLDPGPNVILLDDAFQHRKIRAGLNILLTDYHNLYSRDFLFPAGNLRDSIMAAKRADIIVVTKTPKVFSPFIHRNLKESIKPAAHQKLCFSYLEYGRFIPLSKSNKINFPRQVNNIIMFSGIANPYPLQEHLQQMCQSLVTVGFKDHHEYTEKDILGIIEEFHNILGKSKIMVTTEKDAMRLVDSPYFCHLEHLPVFYVPVKVQFHEKEKSSFDKQVLAYVRENQGNR